MAGLGYFLAVAAVYGGVSYGLYRRDRQRIYNPKIGAKFKDAVQLYSDKKFRNAIGRWNEEAYEHYNRTLVMSDDYYAVNLTSAHTALIHYDQYEGKRVIVISIRGTKDLYDINTDISINEKKVEVIPGDESYIPLWGHTGFLERALKGKAAVRAKLLSMDKDCQYIFTGHSLGASVAYCLAVYFSQDSGINRFTNQVVSVVLGQPPVFSTHRYSHRLSEQMIGKNNHVSVMCDSDPIPFSLAFASGVKLACKFFDEDGKVIALKSVMEGYIPISAWQACAYKHNGWISKVKSTLKGTFKHDVKFYVDGMNHDNVGVEEPFHLH